MWALKYSAKVKSQKHISMIWAFGSNIIENWFRVSLQIWFKVCIYAVTLLLFPIKIHFRELEMLLTTRKVLWANPLHKGSPTTRAAGWYLSMACEEPGHTAGGEWPGSQWSSAPITTWALPPVPPGPVGKGWAPLLHITPSHNLNIAIFWLICQTFWFSKVFHCSHFVTFIIFLYLTCFLPKVSSSSTDLLGERWLLFTRHIRVYPAPGCRPHGVHYTRSSQSACGDIFYSSHHTTEPMQAQFVPGHMATKWQIRN